MTSAGPRDDVAEISDWLWLLDAAADDALAELTPSRRLSGVRADQTVVTPADVLADADLSPADGILLVPGHHELPGGVGEYAVAPIMAGDQRHGWLVAVHRTGAMMLGAGGVLERAAVIAALSVIRLQAVHSVELRFQGDLVRRLVGGSVGHTERTLAYTRSFGWRLDGPVAVLVTATETVADAAADPTKALDVLDRLADGWRAALEPRGRRRGRGRTGHRDRDAAAAGRPDARGAVRARLRRQLAGQRAAAPGGPGARHRHRPARGLAVRPGRGAPAGAAGPRRRPGDPRRLGGHALRPARASSGCCR